MSGAYEDLDAYEEFDGLADEPEWTPGTCDTCLMEPGQVLPGGVCCACWAGQGAAPEDCVCGPQDGTP